ncbi:hypothetical protein BpHYR1_001326 [Brachionus plicatilis]|uniref:Uncharacterized protein n=1 Tax=Brachionus plicatilis TaxID=10195 RepID=A0A3M7T7Y7_BRAPC|nr:hypothetical protein BpHYR1_001326 [Brachionus plicatilis]
MWYYLCERTVGIASFSRVYTESSSWAPNLKSQLRSDFRTCQDLGLNTKTKSIELDKRFFE